MSADRQRIKMLEEGLVAAVGERDTAISEATNWADVAQTAQAETTRLSNYETSYNNLRRIVNDQYNEIGVLADERDLARRDRDNWRDSWKANSLTVLALKKRLELTAAQETKVVAENDRLQRSLELSQHDHEVAVEAQRELAIKLGELVDDLRAKTDGQ